MHSASFHVVELSVVAILLCALVAGALIYTAKLKSSEALWKFALEGAGDGVWDWDIKTDSAKLSPQYKEMFGFKDEDIDTYREIWNNRIHPDDVSSMREAVNNYLSGKTDKYVHEHRVICKDRSVKWVLSRGMIVKRDKNGVPLRMVGTHADITARKALETKLENLAHFDNLCHLPNRTLFNDRLKLALSYAKREKKMLAAMFIDLDQFKEINDLYGHAMGDVVLVEVAKRLVSCVRESDTVARMGGDEFVILLPLIESERDTTTVATKIIEAINQPIILNLPETKNAHLSAKSTPDNHSQVGTHTNHIEKTIKLHVSSSIGIAIYPQHGVDEKLLMINADMAMYHAKRNGKNQAKMFSTVVKHSRDFTKP